MSYAITPFDVSSEALAGAIRVRFLHLLPGIATRHSDTIDCVFLVDGRKVMVGISCATLADIREREKKFLSDQQIGEVAALYLRRTLERGYDATQAELLVGGAVLREMATELGFL